jgi:hypothetical protein
LAQLLQHLPVDAELLLLDAELRQSHLHRHLHHIKAKSFGRKEVRVRTAWQSVEAVRSVLRVRGLVPSKLSQRCSRRLVKKGAQKSVVEIGR